MNPLDPRPQLGDRSMFPDLDAVAYLAHAAISPPSLAARRAVIAHLNALGRRGAMSFPDSLAQRQRLREKLAKLLGAADDEVALCPNTSVGVTDIAMSIPWRAGDGVLWFRGEFPANVTPWQRAAALFELTLRDVDADRYRTDEPAFWRDVDAALAAGVRVVAVSAVQFQTGLRMPLRELAARAHARGAELFVDGIQACGAVPVDVTAEGVDYLAAGGHKWLMGLEGAGVLVVRREAARALRPHLAGWLSHDEPFTFLSQGAGHLRHDRGFRDDARFFEPGTPSAAGYVALEASIDLLATLGVDAIARHVNGYLDALEAGLTARGFRSARSADPAKRSCILSMLAPDGDPRDTPTWQRLLAARGVIASVPDGYLRFAPHWPNGAAEVPRVLDAVDAVLRETAGAAV